MGMAQSLHLSVKSQSFRGEVVHTLQTPTTGNAGSLHLYPKAEHPTSRFWIFSVWAIQTCVG